MAIGGSKRRRPIGPQLVERPWLGMKMAEKLRAGGKQWKGFEGIFLSGKIIN